MATVIPGGPLSVLVIGARGYIGAHIVAALVNAGHRVVAMSRSSAATARQVEVARWVVLDPAQAGALAALIEQEQIEAVIDAAWLGASPGLMADPRNAEAAEALVDRWEQCVAAGVRHWLGFGSCAEYAWDGAGALAEDATLQPASPYGQAKLSAYQRTIMRPSPMIGTWLRPFFVYGGADHPHRLVPSLVQAAQENRPPGLREPERCLDFVQVADVARVAVESLEQRLGGALNVGSGRGVAVGAVAQWVEAAVHGSGAATGIEKALFAAGVDPVVADTRCLRQRLGWQPEPVSARTVQAAVDAYLQAPAHGA